MKLIDIKKELERNNYHAFIRSNGEDGAFIFSGVPSKETLLEPNESFNIFVDENEILLRYFEGHIVTESKYNSIESLMNFIRSTFGK